MTYVAISELARLTLRCAQRRLVLLAAGHCALLVPCCACCSRCGARRRVWAWTCCPLLNVVSGRRCAQRRRALLAAAVVGRGAARRRAWACCAARAPVVGTVFVLPAQRRGCCKKALHAPTCPPNISLADVTSGLVFFTMLSQQVRCARRLHCVCAHAAQKLAAAAACALKCDRSGQIRSRSHLRPHLTSAPDTSCPSS